MGNLLAKSVGVGYVDLKKINISKEVLQTVKEELSRERKVIPFAKEGGSLHLAMYDPKDLETINFIRKVTGLTVVPFLTFEKDMLGFYVSGHPLARYARQLKRFSSSSTSNLLQHKDQDEVKIVCLIARVKQTTTRAKQEKMAILKLEDLEGAVEALVFPRAYQKISRYILPNTVVMVRGILNLKEDTPKILVNDLFPFEEIYKLIIKTKLILNIQTQFR